MKLPFFSNRFKYSFKSKVKNIVIGDTHISIISTTNLDFFFKIFEAILETIVKNDGRIRKFNYVMFSLEDDGRHKGKKEERLAEFLYTHNGSTLGYVNSRDTIRIEAPHGNYTSAIVHLKVDNLALAVLSRYSPVILDKKLQSTVSLNEIEKEALSCLRRHLLDRVWDTYNHEVTHILQNLNDQYKKRLEKIDLKKALIERKVAEYSAKAASASSYAAILYDFRGLVEMLLLKIYSEGTAKLYEKILGGDSLFFYSKSKTFVDLYLKAYETSYKFFERIKVILEVLSELGAQVLDNKPLLWRVIPH